MKTTFYTAAVVAALTSNVAAFPHMMDKLTGPLTARTLEAIGHLEKRIANPQGTGALPLVPPPFDANLQRVSTSGQYAVSFP